jgi:MoxR-like ATPase
VAFADIDGSYLSAMRHRVMVNFEGQAEGVNSDAVLANILKMTPKTAEKAVSR